MRLNTFYKLLICQIFSLCFLLSICFADHFPSPIMSYLVCDYLGKIVINGMDAQVNDEIAVFDNQNTLCGKFKISINGQYGFMHIYGDDPQTQLDEGAKSGETLHFKIWDHTKKIEYHISQLIFSPGNPIGGASPSNIPPCWQSDRIFILDIDVKSTLKGDHNNNGKIDMNDILIELNTIAENN